MFVTLFLLFKILFVDKIKNLLGMYLGLDFFWSKDFLYNAIFINKISGSQNADSFSTASHLLSPTSKFLQQCGFSIGYKRELQTLGIGKFLLQSLFVLTYTYNLITGSCQLFLVGL